MLVGVYYRHPKKKSDNLVFFIKSKRNTDKIT